MQVFDSLLKAQVSPTWKAIVTGLSKKTAFVTKVMLNFTSSLTVSMTIYTCMNIICSYLLIDFCGMRGETNTKIMFNWYTYKSLYVPPYDVI